ncbi:MAG: PaaI family thioesterase [Erysipelotrichaceae bacterium]|nr:PaaI family thioesterase [Erysipelotrichaceae bacterium]
MELKTLEEVRHFFKGDKFATENGAVIEEIGEHYAKCSIDLGDRHKNAVGGIMGGVHFMLADFAFAVASNWSQMGSVSLSSNITFLGMVKGTRLIAEAHCIKEGRSTNYYQIDITDNLDNKVAVVNVTGYRKNQKII